MDGFGANDASVVALRRALHWHPEPAFLEYRTAALAAGRLEGLGYDVRVGPQVMRAEAIIAPPSTAQIAEAQQAAAAAGAPTAWFARMPGGQTGVVAQWRRGDGPVLAFRFDMDALPVNETPAERHRPNQDGYRSRRDGLMHACGHDGHTAIGLAVAERLAQPAAGWRGTLRLIFQPAEEGGRGALPMVAAGMLDDVDWFFACHLGCKLPSGKLAAEATGFLFSRKLDVTFAGQAAHAAMGPQEGRNALLAAATAVLGLHALARHADQITHVNVGRLVAEGARNIVADRADLQMEVRGQTQQSLDLMERRALEVLQGAAAMQGVTVTTTDMGGTIGAVSSPAALRVVSDAAARVAGIGDVLPGWPLGGGEDATFMMQRVQQRGGQAAYFILGSDIPAVHHAADFDIDERALDLGVHVFEQIAAQVLGTTRYMLR